MGLFCGLRFRGALKNLCEETSSPVLRNHPETKRRSDCPCRDSKQGAAMWNIINMLYHEYCLACLNEMQRFEANN